MNTANITCTRCGWHGTRTRSLKTGALDLDAPCPSCKAPDSMAVMSYKKSS